MNDITLTVTIPVSRLEEMALTRRAVLVTIAIALGCVAFVLMAQFVLWYIALAVLAAWTPFAFNQFCSYMRINRILAVYFVFVALQSIHMSEHVAQMIQIHLLGRPFSMSHGILGGPVFDQEWFHFAFDSGWIPCNTFALLVMLRGRDAWLWLMLPVVCWHAAEHIAIMGDYLKTGITGTPGLLAAGGHIRWFLSISRADHHFWYNALETVPMTLGFLAQRSVFLNARKGVRS